MKLSIWLLWFLIYSIPAAGLCEQSAPGDLSPDSDVVERPPIDMNFEDVDIRDFVSCVSEATGTNFILGPDVKGRVTAVAPAKVPVSEVLRFFQSVLEVYGYTTVDAGGAVKIVSSKTAPGKRVETKGEEAVETAHDRVVTQAIRLRYLSPDDAKNLFSPLLSKGGVIVSHPLSGTLIITDFHPNIERLKKMIKALDVPGAERNTAIIGE